MPRIAAALEDRFPEIVAAQPALLAHHCTEAGLTEKAVEYWLAAGRKAWARSATAEAAALLRRGLALVPALSNADLCRETELDLQLVLGQALIMNQSWSAPELAEVYSRVRKLASTLDRPRALVFALLGQISQTGFAADLKRARRLAAELRELGDTTSDIPTQVMGCYASGIVCFHLGEFETGRANLEKGLALYDPAHQPSYSELWSFDMRVALRRHLSWQLACLGHPDQALVQRDSFLDEARRLSHAPTLAFALCGAWVSGWLVRLEPGSLLECADETLGLATQLGLGHYRAFALIFRGWSLAALGRAEEGIPLLIAGLASWDDLGLILVRPWHLTLIADACRMMGQWQEALERADEARHLAHETEDRCFHAETVRLTGDVLAAMGDRAGAETNYHEAIAIAHQQSAKLWELRAATSLAWLWRDQGKRAEAHALLEPVYGWFTGGFGTPVLQEANALLEELAA
jgi:tetratricopeptide (TPR) repeat protein